MSSLSFLKGRHRQLGNICSNYDLEVLHRLSSWSALKKKLQVLYDTGVIMMSGTGLKIMKMLNKKMLNKIR